MLPIGVARTKVTFSEPAPADLAAVVAEPLPEGLSSFDLGTVPASVTPPRSWRKAAWFAMMSSGSVVAALLVAGSYLVNAPPQEQYVEGWPGLEGRPAPNDDGFAPESTAADQQPTDPAALTTTTLQRITDLAAEAQPTTTTTTAKEASTTPPATSTSTSDVPDKPAPEPASRDTRRAPIYDVSAPDTRTMGDRTERFLNSVTEDPEQAHAETGGDLHAEGADGIAQRYAHIAYFEVEHIHIDQERRQTISTVTVVYNDGSTKSEQRTLRFEDGDKITHDSA